MYKFIPTTLMLLLSCLLLFSDCSKSTSEPTGNYTCDCKYSAPNGSIIAYNHFFANQKKSDVTTSCDTLQAQFSRQQGFSNAYCAVYDTLK